MPGFDDMEGGVWATYYHSNVPRVYWVSDEVNDELIFGNSTMDHSFFICLVLCFPIIESPKIEGFRILRCFGYTYSRHPATCIVAGYRIPLYDLLVQLTPELNAFCIADTRAKRVQGKPLGLWSTTRWQLCGLSPCKTPTFTPMPSWRGKMLWRDNTCSSYS